MEIPVEQRAAARKPCNEPVRFTLGEESKPMAPSRAGATLHTAIVFDISATGMGLNSELALHQGQVIHFDPTQPKWSLPARGLIVWSVQRPSGCRLGLEFLL